MRVIIVQLIREKCSRFLAFVNLQAKISSWYQLEAWAKGDTT